MLLRILASDKFRKVPLSITGYCSFFRKFTNKQGSMVALLTSGWQHRNFSWLPINELINVLCSPGWGCMGLYCQLHPWPFLKMLKNCYSFFFFDQDMKLGYGTSRILGYEKFGEGHVVYTLLPTSLLVISKKEM